MLWADLGPARLLTGQDAISLIKYLVAHGMGDATAPAGCGGSLKAPPGDPPIAHGRSHTEGIRNGTAFDAIRDSAWSRTLVLRGTTTAHHSRGTSGPPSFAPPRRGASHGSRHLRKDTGWTEEELRRTFQVPGSGSRHGQTHSGAGASRDGPGGRGCDRQLRQGRRCHGRVGTSRGGRYSARPTRQRRRRLRCPRRTRGTSWPPRAGVLAGARQTPTAPATLALGGGPGREGSPRAGPPRRRTPRGTRPLTTRWRTAGAPIRRPEVAPGYRVSGGPAVAPVTWLGRFLVRPWHFR